MVANSAFDVLPRIWRFLDIDGYRVHSDQAFGMYKPFDLDRQPPAPDGLTGRFEWLSQCSAPEEWAITQDDDGDHTRVQRPEALAEIAGSREVDPAFRFFIEHPELQRKVRSVSGCYLDLADVGVSIGDADGLLCHFLSDQQWVRHWLVWCGPGPRQGSVVTTSKPYGFGSEDWHEPEPASISNIGATDLEVCADSFEEFLFRFWVENELWHKDPSEPGHLSSYAKALKHQNSS